MLTRRELIRAGAISSLTLSLNSVFAHTAHADPDLPAGTPLPADAPTVSPDPEIYPFHIGATEAYIVHDGIFVNPGVQPFFVPEAKPSEVTKLLQESYLPTDRVVLSVNILVLKRPEGIVLVDTGPGAGSIPTAGRLLRGLEKIGIAPDQVSTLIISHAHFDHIGGAITSEGKLVFPNAKMIITDKEAAFWTGVEAKDLKMNVPDAMKQMTISVARKALAAADTKLQRTGYGQILPGIDLVAAPGHTPGHSAILITSGSDKLLHVADAIHVFALQFPHPEWSMAGDADVPLAAATRRSLLARASQERLRVLGYHLPFPGIGHVRRLNEKSYQWAPQPWIS